MSVQPDLLKIGDFAKLANTNLRTLRSSDATIAYEDYLGNSFNVSVDQLVFQPTRHESPRDNTELEAQVVLSRADSGT